MPDPALRIAIDPIEWSCTERELIEHRLQLDGCRIIELGCGRAELTRVLASGGRGRRILALEVDAIQHAKNLQIADLPNVEFVFAGAQGIPAPEAEFDVAFMFKSLHHVPLAALDDALKEIARVLKPGGYGWFSEPIFAGPYNDIIRLFHDEKRERAAAFAAIERAVAAGIYRSVEQIFFNSPLRFPDFAAFEQRVLGATHVHHALSAELYAAVRQRFESHMTSDGAYFEVPMRVDLLRRV